jgi:transmembrane 9 superfamily protein 2/4
MPPGDVSPAGGCERYLIILNRPPHRPTAPPPPRFSIVNSVMIVLFLSGMVAMIMMRTLRSDIAKYNQLDQDEAAEETGWKLVRRARGAAAARREGRARGRGGPWLQPEPPPPCAQRLLPPPPPPPPQVHGDVFRPPQHASLLCTYVGVGVQLFGMLLVTMVFALLGFLSPANRGGLMTAMVMMFVFMGLVAGYSSARLYKQFRGEEWKAMTLRTALLFPGAWGAAG